MVMNLSKKDFNSLKKKGVVKASDLKNIKKENKKYEFSYKVKGKKIKDGYIVIVYGKHFPKNVMNTWHKGIKIRHRKAISNAFYVFRHLYKNLPFFEKVTLEYIVCNPKSRDDDANYDPTKPIRDELVEAGFFKDDKRKFIKDTKEKEKISKKYRIAIIIRKA